MDTVIWAMKRPYTLPYADGVFLMSRSKANLQQFVQKWNARRIQHDTGLNLDLKHWK